MSITSIAIIPTFTATAAICCEYDYLCFTAIAVISIVAIIALITLISQSTLVDLTIWTAVIHLVARVSLCLLLV